MLVSALVTMERKTLQVYEGNTSGDNKGSQSNGDGVYLKKRAYSLVMGRCSPLRMEYE